MLGGPNDRPPLIDDQTREQQSPAWGQNGISVDHEGLLSSKWVSKQLHSTTGSLLNQRPLQRVVTLSQPTCLGTTPSAPDADDGFWC